MKTLQHIFTAAVLMFLTAGTLHAQKYPERRDIRSGNKEYAAGEYSQSEVAYRRALEKNPDSYEAQFNLGNALYKQENYEESAKIFQLLAQDSTHDANIAQCHYNAGNALFQQRKLQESLDAYKNSLRKDPTDMDAKFNLAYVKKLLEEQQGGGGGGDDDKQQDQDQDQDQNQNQNQNKDQNQDQNKDQGDDKQDQQDKQDKGNQDQDKGGNEDKPKPGQQSQQQGGMTQAEAQQMLDAMQAQEDRTQDKVDEQKKGVAVGRSGRNW